MILFALFFFASRAGLQHRTIMVSALDNQGGHEKALFIFNLSLANPTHRFHSVGKIEMFAFNQFFLDGGQKYGLAQSMGVRYRLREGE